MDEQLKQQIKDYLKESLTLDYTSKSDMYGINGDEVTIRVKLDGEVITTLVYNPMDQW